MQLGPLKCITINRLKTQLICSSPKKISVRRVRQAWATACGPMRTNLACLTTIRRQKMRLASPKAANVTSNRSSRPFQVPPEASTALKQEIRFSGRPAKMTILLVRRVTHWTKPFHPTSIHFLALIHPVAWRRTNCIPKSKKDSTGRLTTRRSNFATRSSMAATWWTRTRAANMTCLASSSATAKTSTKTSGIAPLPTSQLRPETNSFISQISNSSDALSLPLSVIHIRDLIILARYNILLNYLNENI